MAKETKPEFEDIYVLSAALEGLELQKQRIEGYIRQVRSMLGGRQKKTFALDGAFETALAGKRRLSAAARKNISSAQKKRWAAYREDKRRQSKNGR